MGFAEDYVVDAVTSKAKKAIEEKTTTTDTFMTFVFVEKWKMKVGILAGLIGTMLICAAIDIGMGGKLHKLGIHPRTLSGVLGIPLAPFLHVSLTALASNAMPLLLIGSGVMMRERGISTFAYLCLAVTVLAGAGVWAFGEDQLHTGSNVLVFGCFGYVVMNAVITRNARPIIIAGLSVIAYGPVLASHFIHSMSPAAAAAAAAVPGNAPQSWMYMGFGSAAGAVFAAFHARFEADGFWGIVSLARGSDSGDSAIRPGYGRKEHGTEEERESLKGYNRV